MLRLRKIMAATLIFAILTPNAIIRAEEKQQSVVKNSTSSEIKESDVKGENIYQEESKEFNVNNKYIMNTTKVISDYNLNDFQMEREEFKLKLEGLKSYTNLQNKTSDEFEVAIANSDGSYTFVDSSNDYNEAVDILKKIPNTLNENEATPVILDANGQVVYATNYMIRFLKNVNGVPHFGHSDDCYKKDKDGKFILDKYGNKILRETHPADTTNIYTDSNLTNAYTYVNQGYVDDAPVIESTSNAVKVQVSGYNGWVNNKYIEKYKDANGKEIIYNWSDIIMVPISQATNPSYYYVKNGLLNHSISSNLQATANSSNFAITIGVAPNYLKEGVTYLSYDGNYFYTASNIQTSLNNMITDLKAGNKNNAVNKTSPYYAYYQHLPFRSKSIYSATELDTYINNNTEEKSKLRGMGQALKGAENTYGVNASLMLSIAFNESAKGMSPIAQSKNNVFGLRAYDSNPGLAADEFPSVEACINDFAKNWISSGYADPSDWRYYGGYVGNKKLGANVKYASDPFWGEKATKYALELDLQLSGGVSNLRDTNRYQLAIFNSTNEVINKSGQLLYKIDGIYGAVGNVFIVTNKDKQNINGKYYYEMFPERNTPVTSGNSGTYNWNDRGYVQYSNVSLINIQQPIQPYLTTVAGTDRYKTAVELSKSKYSTTNAVIIVNDKAVIDGVTVSPLAYAMNAPILLTDKNYLSADTKNEITRLKAKKVIIIGSEASVSNSVINDFQKLGISDITRLSGKDRYRTSLAIAQYIDKNYYDVSNIFMVGGNGEADAVSISAIAANKKMPILLTTPSALGGEMYSWLKSEGLNNAYTLGGKEKVSDNVINQLNGITKTNLSGSRIAGVNRYETNAKIISKFYSKDISMVYVTESVKLVDALAAGPIAAKDGAPVCLVDTDLSIIQKQVFTDAIANKIVQVGKDVSSTAINNLRNILKRFRLT